MTTFRTRIKNIKNVGIVDQQKPRNKVGMIAYNSSVHNSTLHIFNVERYVG